MQTKYFVEVDADGIVMQEVSRTADDWDTVTLPASWVEVADKPTAVSLLQAVREKNGAFTPLVRPPVVITPQAAPQVAMGRVTTPKKRSR